MQLVNGENGAAIDSVMVDGRFVLRESKIVTLDDVKLRRDAERAFERLVAANADAEALGRGFEDVVGAFCFGQAHKSFQLHRALHEHDYR